MANNKNHHFVPQFFFRNFVQINNKQKIKTINMLIKKNGNIIENVSIKDQASKNNFYLDKNIEKIYSDVEGKHCKLLNIINNIDSIKDYTKESKNFSSIFQVVLFQYLRTLDMLNRIKSISEDFSNELLKQIINNNHEINNLIQTEKVKKEDLIKSIKISFHKKYFNKSLNEKIAYTFVYQEVIKDLKIYILNNKTDREFIFSDNPVVFYNLAFNHIKNNSMTAMQSPGLMIFFPISQKKCILLLDEDKYIGSLIKNYFFNITNETDINSINKLQIHNCTNSIYFSDIKKKKYISQLYRQEKNALRFNRKDVKVDKNTLMIIPEKINYKINLSFLCPKDEINNSNIKYRNKDLYQVMKIGHKVLNFIKNEAESYRRQKEISLATCDVNEANSIILNKLKEMKVDDF
ncbi:DUF4238 domain-containing protein [Arcobacter sp. F155]|uniref:DUF4238 domain-containing protein n=1 Tax=Arcobacter sp. F155 TaxID=2044512 RepID=UPI0013E99874|nr:DUF4238 domain-containing protein [Arcobacter sp. F155]